MILLCGIPSEKPMAMVAAALESLAAPVVIFHQRRFDEMRLAFEVSGGAVRGVLTVGGQAFPLERFTAVYTRLMDDRVLPELDGEPESSSRRRKARALHEALTRWMEIAPARVLNRAASMGSNASKPYQAQLIRRHGFRIPETVVTNDPEMVRELAGRCGRVIFKSVSGVRSIVRALADADWERIDAIRWCPTQFQAFVPGTNVRVHVVGRDAIATAAVTDAVDYRYAAREGLEPARLQPYVLPDDIADRCVRLSHALGLGLAGVDLKITPDGEVFCFEVNPSPAFSYYELNTGQPIAETIARYLTTS